MLRRALPRVLVSVAALAPAQVFAQGAPPFLCGPDCTTPGQYVLCNDSFDHAAATMGSLRISGFLEGACTSFTAPAASFAITGFVALFDAGELFVSLVQVYDELGNAAPGPLVFEGGAGIPSAGQIGFSGLFFSAAPAGDFRLCLRQQIDDPSQTFNVRPLMFDADGTQHLNTTFQPAGGVGWQVTPGSGDFILRAVVTYNDLTPWQAGGVCAQPPPQDAGAGMDAAPNADAAGDAGVPAMDAGGEDAGAGDAGAGDAGAGDAGSADAEATDTGGGGPVPPPAITAITPDKGSNATPVDVIVTGTGFADGLKLTIGTIAANGVDVPGTTTINAQIPANIAPGVYDVIVENPDGQAAVLTDGYEVTSSSASPGVEDGCGCGVTRAPGGAGVVLLLAALFLRGRRRR